MFHQSARKYSVRSITVTSQPDKTWYRSGENIDYTGMVITAACSEDTAEDVSDLCTITPRAGKPFTPENDSYVEISFDDNSSAMLQLNELYLLSHFGRNVRLRQAPTYSTIAAVISITAHGSVPHQNTATFTQRPG